MLRKLCAERNKRTAIIHRQNMLRPRAVSGITFFNSRDASLCIAYRYTETEIEMYADAC